MFIRGHKLLSFTCYKNRVIDKEDERLGIVNKAAQIVYETYIPDALIFRPTNV